MAAGVEEAPEWFHNMPDAVIPQFEPEGSPGETVGISTQVGNATSSWATQAQQRAASRQNMQQQAAQFQIMQPVLQAKAQADITGSMAQIANAKRMEQFRTEANTAAPQAQQEFLDATKIADWDEQANELGALQAKYSFMGNIPEYKPFLDAVDNARHKAETRALMDKTMEAKQNQLDALVQGRSDVAAQNAATREDVAQIGADARTGAATIGATARTQAAQIGGDARVAAAGVRANQPAEIERLNNRAQALELEAQDPDLDPAESQIYRTTAQQLRNRAGILGRDTGEATAATMTQAQQAPKPKAARPAGKGSGGIAPITFNVPGEQGAENTPAEQKLYVVPTDGSPPQFSPQVKSPQDVIKATQQMVDDGVITADQARETLTKLGFKKKGS